MPILDNPKSQESTRFVKHAFKEKVTLPCFKREKRRFSEVEVFWLMFSNLAGVARSSKGRRVVM